MKINEVEAMVGITRKNIRFYEKEGLLHPARNLDNGYRDYKDEDVEILKKIKLLRKLAVPLEEIRALQNGRITLEDGLSRHLIVLNRESKNLEQTKSFCRHILEKNEQLDTIDVSSYLTEMEEMEKEGMRFLNVQQVDMKRKRWIGALLGGITMIILCVWLFLFLMWAFLQDTAEAPPLALLAVILALPVIAIICTIYAMYQRKKEIQKGEEDAASKY